MRTKWAFHPEDYRLGENESFYSDMAAKGWRLESRGGYMSRFSRVNPERVLYRVELDYREPTAEQFALYEECGWEWVTKRGAVNVYRATERTDPPELYTDAGGLAGSIRRLRNDYVRTLILALAVFALLGWVILLQSGGGRSFWTDLLYPLVLYPEIPLFNALIAIYVLASTLMGSFAPGGF